MVDFSSRVQMPFNACHCTLLLSGDTRLPCTRCLVHVCVFSECLCASIHGEVGKVREASNAE